MANELDTADQDTADQDTEVHAPGTAAFDLTGFTCPRCARLVSGEYYGPCDACRDELRATYQAQARVVEAAAYEPKMNVTPNAVASKE
jgi:hypothetical protein